MSAHGDAMFGKVCVWAVLKSPTLAAKLNGNDAQVLTSWMSSKSGRSVSPRVAFIFNTQLAGGVFLAGTLCGSRGLCGF